MPSGQRNRHGNLSQRHGFLVLPGSEINTDAGHVLAFGLRRYEFGMHKPEFLRACADRDGGVLIAAHPYRRRFLEEPGRDPTARAGMLERAVADPFFDLCEAVEGLNGRGSVEQNRYSADLGASLVLPATAGSDAHRVAQLGTAATEFHGKIECVARPDSSAEKRSVLPRRPACFAKSPLPLGED